MKKVEIRGFVEGPILRETAFRAAIEAHDWEQYRGERVLIQGCADIIIPTWAYLVVTAQLVRVAERVMFGEQKTRIPIYARGKDADTGASAAAEAAESAEAADG